MISNNELRIDNWVTDARTNTFVQIGGIHVSGIIYTEDHECDDWKRSIEPVPIPLTPEILEQVGFKKEDKLRVNAQTYYKFGMGEYLTYHFDGFCQFEFGTKPAIKYLHQLQNLYFALTGEELKVNLNVATLPR